MKNYTSQKIAMALEVRSPLPEHGYIWKMSDGNGLVSVNFDKCADFFDFFRQNHNKNGIPTIESGDILICEVDIYQSISVDDKKRLTLNKSLHVTGVSAISNKMVWLLPA
ncbi:MULTISPECIES: hypothetical protein [Acetobacter]|uniref:Uncharacterized protein n=2 Tax=Acetobacter TaxID=434 RepID=A0A401WXZ6_ACEPA|nr:MULTISPECIES: hypothetical protein [Acetobacter]GCD54191.1 hypothetical protein NBRC3188_2888 [Acetobacter pasteurianus NBRC 3188]